MLFVVEDVIVSSHVNAFLSEQDSTSLPAREKGAFMAGLSTFIGIVSGTMTMFDFINNKLPDNSIEESFKTVHEEINRLCFVIEKKLKEQKPDAENILFFDVAKKITDCRTFLDYYVKQNSSLELDKFLETGKYVETAITSILDLLTGVDSSGVDYMKSIRNDYQVSTAVTLNSYFFVHLPY